jgi:Mce-associated membrane protein
VYVLAAAVLLASAVAGSTWHQDRLGERRDRAAQEALAGATAAAQALFSYDYRTFDASVANGKTFAAGNFAKEYATTTASLKGPAQTEHAVVRAQVSAVGVVHASATEVELLVYLNQYRSNVNITGEKVDQNRVRLTMVPVGGDWKVSNASAI